jgi:TonB family protein
MANKSITEQLQKLHDLKQKGILSEAEYNEQKAKILAGTTKVETPSFSPPVQEDAVVIALNTFISKHKFILTGLAIILLIGFGVYYFVFMPNPVRDAKTVREESCSCAQKAIDDLTKIDSTFLNEFDSYKFQSPADAKAKWEELQKPVEIVKQECEAKTEVLRTAKRAAFGQDSEAQSKFDSLSSYGCGLSGSTAIQYVVQKIEEKIQNMIDYSLLDPDEQGDGFDPGAELVDQLPGPPDDNGNRYQPGKPTPTESVQQTVAVAVDMVKEEPKILTYAERSPQFPGGDAALMQYIKGNIQYPQMERDNDIQGKVITRCVVMEDGRISDVNVIRGVSIGLDNEAVRLVKTLPKFIPGYQNGKPVRVYYNLPVVFKLVDQWNNSVPNSNKKQEQREPSDNLIITSDVAYLYTAADVGKISKNFVTKGTILTKGKETISFYYCFYKDKNNQTVDGYIRKVDLKVYYP